MDEILSCLDAELNQAVKNYIDNLTKQNISELDAKSKFFEQWSALSTYFSAMQLSAAGNKFYLMYWNVKPLIENLGSGTVDIVSNLFGNRKTLQLYHNEIKGVAAMNWKKFPDALIVSNKEFRCEPIEDKLTEIAGLLKFMRKIGASPA